MKYIATLLLAVFSMAALADHPRLTVSGNLDLVFDETIEITDLGLDTVSQFNHKAPQIVDIDIRRNKKVDDIDIDGSALGNNLSADLVDSLVVVQGNQVGGQDIDVDIRRNRHLDEIDIDLTAVGNNADVVVLDDVFLGNAQFNKRSPVSIDVDIVKNNRHRYHPHSFVLEPEIDLTAIGNNLSLEGAPLGVTGIANVQLNKKSPISIDLDIRRNRGVVGDIDVDVTSVGNNLSVDTGL